MLQRYASFCQKMYDPPRPCKGRFDQDDAVCTNVSGLLQVGRCCGQAMMRSACRSQINGPGSKPAFLHRAYGAPIDCLVITFTSLAVWNKRDQLKAGSRRS
ncbi:hypothetical protein ACVWXN_006620 [Bradyrhizobium sp. i1.4.4]